ncbi:MAG: OmpA family protein [Deltaproteobacteria bacterium]|nr:OmpA family protein [Deltaproteobacteria bacterium]
MNNCLNALSLARCRFATASFVAGLLVLGSPLGAHAQNADDAVAGTVEGSANVARSVDDPGDIAPTIGGLSGLFRTVSGRIGRPHTFRVGVHGEISASSISSVVEDDNTRFAGTLAVNYTPWRLLEFFANFRSHANSNARTDTEPRLDQEVIHALGDVSFGGKFQYPLLDYLSLGANFSVDLLNSTGSLSVDSNAVGFYIGMLASFDAEKLNADIPLGFHFNFGYQLDNSNGLASFDRYPLASLEVEKLALGIKPSRLQVRMGSDFRLRKWTGFGLTPIIELGLDVATGDEDSDFFRFVPTRPEFDPNMQTRIQEGDLAGRTTAWLTLGVRSNPIRGLIVSLASDIGLQSPGFGFGSPVLPWNLIIGIGYAYDPKPQLKVVEKERVKIVHLDAKPKEGKVRGRIINAKTNVPIAGAVVTFPGRDLTGLSSDPDGGFLSYRLPPGKVPVMVRHPDYLPGKVLAMVTIGNESKLEVRLDPAPPKASAVTGRVTDDKGAAVAAAGLTFSGPENKTASSSADGAFGTQLAEGQYTVRVGALGYMRKMVPLTITAGTPARLDVTLTKRPRRSLVLVTKRSIVIRKKVHFATGTDQIRPDSQQLLDEVVDVLLSNAQIKHVEIGGHTDNRGIAQRNLELSQRRAEAVRDYLVKNGVPSERLTARGYGASKPKVPNLTPRNRARNRRVEFRITAQ